MRKCTHAEIATRRLSEDNIQQAARVPIIAALDNVRSLYNVGSIFRTSDGCMIEKLILGGFTPYPPRKEIEKTALGSTKSIPWEYTKDLLSKLQQLKQNGYTLCCLELTDSSIPYYEIKASSFPLCLIIGNEITGVSKEIISICDQGLEIPMYGIKQSLNVAVAYGIAVFELSRIWRNSNQSKERV